MIDLTNQVAVVTGGSRAIGAATAVLFAQTGADVAILYSRDRGTAERTLKTIARFGRKGMAIPMKIENYPSCQRAIAKVIQKFGQINILVNSAGIWEYGDIFKMSPDDWQRSIDINLTGTFNVCHAVLPIMMKEKYGKIINVSSTAGQRGEVFHSHYAAAKGGIIAFTKSLGPELIRHGIWVNCVAPGWVATDMVSGVFKNPRNKSKILQTIPRGTIATPEEIAGPILFLASRYADNIVGEILNVNGGSVLCG
jgi:3-oxoacyl-[acyl-carrier protein] reductase